MKIIFQSQAIEDREYWKRTNNYVLSMRFHYEQ